MAPKDKEKELARELKAPDQFVSLTTKLGEAAAARGKALFLGALGLIVVALVVWGLRDRAEGRAEEMSRAFARIEKIATASLLPATGEAKVDDDLPHFKTAEERLGAAVKEADAFLSAHGASKLEDEASLLKASYLLTLGKPGEALPIYQRLAGSLDERFRFLAREGLALAHEASGQDDKAIEIYTALANEGGGKGNDFYWDRALYNKARLLARRAEAKNDAASRAEAEKLFKQILEKAPATALRRDIDNHLSQLEGK